MDGYQGTLAPTCVTIAQVLKQAGYGTYAVGKWHVTSDDGPRDPKDKGAAVASAAFLVKGDAWPMMSRRAWRARHHSSSNDSRQHYQPP
jgi:arylsulfatase A-like enzyme